MLPLMSARLSRRLALLAAALWWGALSAVIGLAVPLLFAHLPTKALAAGVAVHLFTAQAWLSVACGMVLLLLLKRRAGDGRDAHARTTVICVVAAMLLALLVEFAVGPRILARGSAWHLWHAGGTAMFFVQWLLAAVVLWRLAESPR